MANQSPPPVPPKPDEELDFKPIRFQLKPLDALVSEGSEPNEAVANHSMIPSESTSVPEVTQVLPKVNPPDFLASMFTPSTPEPSLPSPQVQSETRPRVSLGDFALGGEQPLPPPIPTAEIGLPGVSLFPAAAQAEPPSPILTPGEPEPSAPLGTQIIRDPERIQNTLYPHLIPRQVERVRQGGTAIGLIHTPNGPDSKLVLGWDLHGLYANIQPLPTQDIFTAGLELSEEQSLWLPLKGPGLFWFHHKKGAINWLKHRRTLTTEDRVLILESNPSVSWAQTEGLHSVLWGEHLHHPEDCIALVKQLEPTLVLLEIQPGITQESVYRSALWICRERLVFVFGHD